MRQRVQAPPLVVAAVVALEEAALNDSIATNVRIIAGFALFCIGGNVRHGDAVRILAEPTIEPASVAQRG